MKATLTQFSFFPTAAHFKDILVFFLCTETTSMTGDHFDTNGIEVRVYFSRNVKYCCASIH